MENFNIIEEKENSLFKRKEVRFTVDAEVTPSHADARKIISEKFSIPEENTRIKNILGKFGSKNFTISAHIYASEQDKLDTEGQSKKDGAVIPEEPAQPEQAGDTPLQNPEDKSEVPTEAPTKSIPTKETPIEKPVEAPTEVPPEPQKSEELDNKPKEETTE